jgi:hypothetical protein
MKSFSPSQLLFALALAAILAGVVLYRHFFFFR